MHEVINLNQPFCHLNMILGEGPLWHPLEERLYWLDIEAGTLFRSPLKTRISNNFL